MRMADAKYCHEVQPNHCSSSVFFDDGADGSLAFFDAFGEFELDSGPVEVLAVVPGLEIDVSGDEIGKEPQAEFERDQPDGIVEVMAVGFGEELAGVGHVAFDDGLAHVGVKIDALEVEDFLAGRVAARP